MQRPGTHGNNEGGRTKQAKKSVKCFPLKRHLGEMGKSWASEVAGLITEREAQLREALAASQAEQEAKQHSFISKALRGCSGVLFPELAGG